MSGLQVLLTANNVTVFVSSCLCSSPAIFKDNSSKYKQYFVTDLKQSNKDMEDKMYYSITALSDIYGTGNNSRRRYLAATEKKSEKIEDELDFLF